MTEQPEALRLAAEFDNGEWIAATGQWREEAAAELRRLFELAHEQHSEIYGLRLKVMNLQKALHWIADRCPLMLMEQPLHGIHKEMAHDAGACARAAIGEAGEQK